MISARISPSWPEPIRVMLCLAEDPLAQFHLSRCLFPCQPCLSLTSSEIEVMSLAKDSCASSRYILAGYGVQRGFQMRISSIDVSGYLRGEA